MTSRRVIRYQLVGSLVDLAESVVNASITTKMAPTANSIHYVPNWCFCAQVSRISHDSLYVTVEVAPPQIRVK